MGYISSPREFLSGLGTISFDNSFESIIDRFKIISINKKIEDDHFDLYFCH